MLDVGAGASPCVAPADRPEGCRYVGLDVDAAELAKAPPGSYDETVAADATRLPAELRGSADLVVSWFAFEHIEPLPDAIAGLRDSLRPGGRLLATLAGGRGAASVANRVLPAGVKEKLLLRLFGREPDSVFPAHYDRCTASGLTEVFEAGDWAEFEVLPVFVGAPYFAFSKPTLAAYIAYEEWAYRTGRQNLSPYYVLDARAPA